MTPETHNICIIIPTFNNAGTVRDVAKKSLKVAPVIVVDDGCTDDTEEQLNSLNIEVVRHASNKGKGAALKSGFKKALELGFTHAVSIDADGQHYPSDIPAMIRKSRENIDAVVIGVRDMATENVPVKSTIGRRFSNYWLRNATGVEPGDSQSGFRVYPLKHVSKVFCWTRGFPYECEVLIRLMWAGVPLRRVQIDVYYPPADERVSHFNPLWDNIRFTLLYIYMNFRHLLVPLPHRKLVKHKLGFWARMRELAALPKEVTSIKGGPIKRTRKLISYLGHESNSSAQLALAVGFGVFIGTSPWIGFHWLIAIYAATRFRLNRAATLIATNVSFGPMTAIWALSSVWLGKIMLGQEFSVPNTTDFEALRQILFGAFGAWVLGSMVIGLVASSTVGAVTLVLLNTWRKKYPAAQSSDKLPELTTSNSDTDSLEITA